MENQNNDRQFIANDNLEAAEKLKYTPVAPGSTTYHYDVFPEDTFDVKPMLKYLYTHDGPEVLKHIHHAIGDLTSYYIDGEGNGLTCASAVLRTLRDLETALLSGFRLVDLDKSFAADEEPATAGKIVGVGYCGADVV